jgi:hypothetical protein
MSEEKRGGEAVMGSWRAGRRKTCRITADRALRRLLFAEFLCVGVGGRVGRTVNG